MEILGQSNASNAEDMHVYRASLINGMTNWQSAKMLKACKGNPAHLSTELLTAFAQMPHWKINAQKVVQ